MSSKAQRKIRQHIDQIKAAVKQKDLGIRLVVLGPLLTYTSLTFLVTPQPWLPAEATMVGVFAGLILVFVGTVLIERAFRKLLATMPGTAQLVNQPGKQSAESKPEITRPAPEQPTKGAKKVAG